MTQDALLRSLETDALPEAGLRAAMDQAALLAPAVLALLARPASAPMPLLAEQRLLHRGLHVLAAARNSPAFRPLAALLHEPSWGRLAQMLGPHWAVEAPGLLLGLFDGDAAPVFAIAEDQAATDSARWAAMLVLTRLVWEGRAARAALLDLLDRIDRSDPALPDSLVWLGLQDAVRLLGLLEWQERIADGWRAGRLAGFDATDRATWTRLLHDAARQPDDQAGFIREGALAFEDPVAALQRLSYPLPEADAPLPGPGLPADARRWLDDLLWLHPPLPGRSMSLEEADGFLTALAAGPAPLPIAQAIRRVLGASPAHRPAYPSRAHGELAETLLAAHAEAIAARMLAGGPPAPHGTILPENEADISAAHWAQGFARGAGQDQAAWQRVLAVPRARAAFDLIAGLIPPQGAPRPPASTLAMIANRRQSIIARVPAAVRAIADTSRGLAGLPADGAFATSLPRPAAASGPIGRNAPCPCGSGRKFKHCCGAHTTGGSAMIATPTR